MKIAVIGLYYAANLGDAIICDSVAFWLKENYPSADIDVIDIEGKECFEQQRDTSLLTLQRRKWKLDWDSWLTRRGIEDRIYYWNKIDVESRAEFYDEVVGRQYDAAVFAGGQLFMDWLSVDVCEFVKRFKKVETPVFFNACGTGFSASKKISEILSENLMYENVKLISTRDNIKKIEETYLSSPKRVISTFDPALWTKEVYQVEAQESEVVGLGVMYSTHVGINKITRFWKKLIRELDARNIKWKMFCNGAIDDYNYGCYILKKMGLNVEEHIYDYARTPEELVKQIASFESLISFRLHSHIVAASLGIPAVALVWDEKLRFFYKNIGHEERCKMVQDFAEDVINMLGQAKREGCNMELIQKQKMFARQLLLDAVQEEVRSE